jgi:sialate O-acetylesterase
MDFTVAKTQKKYFAGVENESQEIAAADYPQIRMFTVELKLSDTLQPDVVGRWIVCSPQTVGDFSAVAYFFGRDLYKKRGVPMGFITSTWGASTAQCWTSREALIAEPTLKPLVDAYDATIKTYSPESARAEHEAALKAWEEASAKAKAEGKRAPRKPGAPRNPHEDQHNPTLLYNGMIAPVKPYAIRGAIWYQGESNGPTANEYYTLMKTLIADWRKAWGEGDFPFLFVQLANINALATQPVQGRSTVALVREGQMDTLKIPNTGMAVTIDIGDAANVHPKNKQEVGRRLALAAQALVYREPIAYSGPLYDTMQVEGSRVRLRFKHTEGGLKAKDDKLIGFAIAGEDGKFVWADAQIDGETVVVSSPDVPKPTVVRYGWADNPPVSLYNGAGLPASPFRTDHK